MLADHSAILADDDAIGIGMDFDRPADGVCRQHPGQSRRRAAAARHRPDLPQLRHVFADRVYRGDKFLNAVADLDKWAIEIVPRSQSVGTFKAEPRHCVVECTFAWLGRNRRLAKDFETTIASAKAWIMIASVRLL